MLSPTQATTRGAGAFVAGSSARARADARAAAAMTSAAARRTKGAAPPRMTGTAAPQMKGDGVAAERRAASRQGGMEGAFMGVLGLEVRISFRGGRRRGDVAGCDGGEDTEGGRSCQEAQGPFCISHTFPQLTTSPPARRSGFPPARAGIRRSEPLPFRTGPPFDFTVRDFHIFLASEDAEHIKITHGGIEVRNEERGDDVAVEERRIRMGCAPKSAVAARRTGVVDSAA